VFNGILWILRTGAPWADLPDRYPSYQTCHRRFQQWVRSGVLRNILDVLAQALLDDGYLDLQESPFQWPGRSLGRDLDRQSVAPTIVRVRQAFDRTHQFRLTLIGEKTAAKE
jgi:transposase